MNVVRIFARDLRRLGRNPMALVVAMGVAALPALYAWFNIAANWDPYGSTGGIRVAVACEDEGFSLEGLTLNIGEQIVENLRSNTQIGWQFVDAQEAVAGVERGDYYAGIVIPADFSRRLASILSDDIQQPTLDYYINEKKNAIAPKITDKGVSAVQQQVNETFSDEVTQAVASALSSALDLADDSGLRLSDRVLDRLREADDALSRVSTTLEVFQLTARSVNELTAGSQALLPGVQGTVDEAGNLTDRLGGLLTASQAAARQSADSVGDLLDAVVDAFDDAGADGVDALRRLEELELDPDALADSLRALEDSLRGSADQLDEAIRQLRRLSGQVDVTPSLQALEHLKASLQTLQSAVEEAARLAGRPADAMAPEGELRARLAALSRQAADLVQNTIAPRLEEKQAQLAALPPDDLLRQRLLTAEITGLSAAKGAAEQVQTAFDDQHLDLLWQSAQGRQAHLQEIAGSMGAAAGQLSRLQQLIGRMPGGAGQLSGSLDSLSGLMDSAARLVDDAVRLLNSAQPLPDGLSDRLSDLIRQVDSRAADARAAVEETRPALNDAVDQAFVTLSSLSGVLTQFSGTLPQLGEVLTHVDGAMGSAAQALALTGELVEASRGDLRELMDSLQSAQQDERLDQLAGLLKNDAAAMGSFMAAPVQVETHSFFPIANYGSAMAAFYSVLAFWVGGIVLVAILKVNVDEDETLNHLRPHQRYLGRYLLFLLFGLTQSTIICLGDVYFLGIQCTSVPLLLLAGWVTSFVFTLIIYTLTASFGDVGKALAVILLVIQLAGSGGTFPIEVTPPFFQGVYPFLPFTHGINAMREVIAGQYQNAYWMDLLKLLAFVPLALLLGLVLRKPLIRLNTFFEERLESTHLM